MGPEEVGGCGFGVREEGDSRDYATMTQRLSMAMAEVMAEAAALTLKEIGGHDKEMAVCRQ